MGTAPTSTRRLLRTKQAAAYLSVSEWKLRRLIQSAIFPIVQDQEGGPFLLDVRDLDAYVERNKHHVVNATDWRPIPYPECNGGRRRRSAQAKRGRLGCLLCAPEADLRKAWFPCWARSA